MRKDLGLVPLSGQYFLARLGRIARVKQPVARTLPSNDGEVWFEFTAVQLVAGDRQGYRETRKRILGEFPQSPKMRGYLQARACTLSPESIDAGALPLQVCRELDQFPTASWSLTEQGVLKYRSQRYKEAVPLFQASLMVETKPGAEVLNWLWLALAYHTMSDKDEAQRWQDKAGAWRGVARLAGRRDACQSADD